MGRTKFTERLCLIGQLIDRSAQNQFIVQIFTFYLLMFKTTQDVDVNSTVHCPPVEQAVQSVDFYANIYF